MASNCLPLWRTQYQAINQMDTLHLYLLIEKRSGKWKRSSTVASTGDGSNTSSSGRDIAANTTPGSLSQMATY